MSQYGIGEDDLEDGEGGLRSALVTAAAVVLRPARREKLYEHDRPFC